MTSLPQPVQTLLARMFDRDGNMTTALADEPGMTAVTAGERINALQASINIWRYIQREHRALMTDREAAAVQAQIDHLTDQLTGLQLLVGMAQPRKVSPTEIKERS